VHGEPVTADDARSLTLRDAKLEDAPALARLMVQLGYDTSSSEMTARLRAILPDRTYHTLVAVKDGAVVGMIGVGVALYYERNGRYARILALSVTDTARGNGIGSRLLRAAEEWARAAGAGSMIVNSGHQRTEAHAFYEHHGYRPTGIRFIKPLGDAA